MAKTASKNSRSTVENKILCPCRKCVNSFWRESSDAREHLICDGFLKGYTTWNLHEEASSCMNHGNSDGVDIESNEEDVISELLRHLACGLDDRGDFEDNNCFVSNFLEDGLIEVLTCYLIYLMMHCLRVRFYLETTTKLKKMIKSIGIGYICIHACPNDCVLYRKENEKSDSCPK
ncbi:LOW QUALITY PROTEIN: hypothetical protein U9M48_031181, partial [Paspalum notatum var. saurae]